jgi:hypothetical protein
MLLLKGITPTNPFSAGVSMQEHGTLVVKITLVVEQLQQ